MNISPSAALRLRSLYTLTDQLITGHCQLPDFIAKSTHILQHPDVREFIRDIDERASHTVDHFEQLRTMTDEEIDKMP